jgi:ABC-2 type transport system permease protein
LNLPLTELRATVHLAHRSLLRQLRSKKVLLGLLFLAIESALVIAAGFLRSWRLSEFVRFVALGTHGLFFVPVMSLVFGTGAVGDEREDKSLVYLIVRPIPRSGIFFAKYAAVLPIVLALNLGGMALLATIAAAFGAPGPGTTLSICLPAMLLSSAAYLALFHLFGCAFRHSTVLALAYVFFIEVFLGRAPGILKRLSIGFYTTSLVRAEGDFHWPRHLSEPFFIAVGPGLASWVLLGSTVAFLVLGCLLFTRREYRVDG